MSAGNGEQRKKAAYLAMPCYGGPTAGAARAFFRASAGALDLCLRYLQSSLINTNCNGLWAWALNAARKGERVDYFAMLHADVQPGDFWLDALVAELESRGLDVLAAAVPIKDPRGLTSTAVGHPDQSPDWRPLCRITMRELYRLPETFTAADLGHPDKPLLINTGCWVCRFDPSWAERVYFEIKDRIFYRPEDGLFHADTIPEDWSFARRLWEAGLKVGVTRKLELTHHGPTNYSSGGPWGEYEYDREYLDAPALATGPAAGAGGFPFDVGGWLTEAEGRELERLAEGRRVLEVGSYLGRSTVCLARTAAHVVAVDPFDGRATPAPRATFDAFLANLRRYGVEAKVRPRVGTFAEVAPDHLAPGYFDLVFIDADHRREAVTEDIRLALPLLAPGGLLAFHDYGRPKDPGVRQAVDAELLAAGGELVSLTETLAVVRPPAAAAPLAPETSLALSGVR
jgi:SAM-dependent methyltransferase